MIGSLIEDGTPVSRDYMKTKNYFYAKVHKVEMFMYNIYIIATKTNNIATFSHFALVEYMITDNVST